MSKRQYPTIEFVRQCFRYQDGVLYWIERPRTHFNKESSWRRFNKLYANKIAGSLYTPHGERRIRIALSSEVNGKCYRYFRHTIVWVLHKNEWRIGLDHINRNSLDDRIENLRICNGSQNNANRNKSKGNKSGYRGIHQCKKTGKWIAGIKVNKKKIHLGSFIDPKEAYQVYCSAAKKYFADFASSE